MWCGDSVTSHRSLGSIPNRNPELTAEARMFLYLRSTGLGSPVVPEVNTTHSLPLGSLLGESIASGLYEYNSTTDGFAGSSTETIGSGSAAFSASDSVSDSHTSAVSSAASIRDRSSAGVRRGPSGTSVALSRITA